MDTCELTSPKFVIYVRVSTGEQSTEAQLRDLRAYVVSRGWSEAQVFEDVGTGTNDRRTQFQAMMVEARERKIDGIICWKLDRLFRSLKHLVLTLQELQALGVQFISLKDHIDLTTASGRLMTHIIGAFAEFEASIIRERVRTGLANARSKGKRLGRPRKRDDIKIAELRAQGLSIRRIAKQLNVSPGAVQRALSVSKTNQIEERKPE